MIQVLTRGVAALTTALLAAASSVSAQEPGATPAAPTCEWISRTELACEADTRPGPETIEIGLGEARTSVKDGLYPEAVEILSQIVDDETEDRSLLTLYGEILVASGQAEQAVPILERAIVLAPDKERLHFQLATAYNSLGMVDEALAAFSREIELNEHPEVQFLAQLNSSILLGQTERYVEAAAALEKALELQPEHPQAYGELATLYLRTGDAAKASATLSRGADIGFRSARLYFNVGARLYNDRSYAEAERAFARALEIDPRMADAERSQASALSQLGRDTEAREHLARYLELRPDAPDVDAIREQIDASAN
jgi:Flp pilus assembly protein TadD